MPPSISCGFLSGSWQCLSLLLPLIKLDSYAWNEYYAHCSCKILLVRTLNFPDTTEKYSIENFLEFSKSLTLSTPSQFLAEKKKKKF